MPDCGSVGEFFNGNLPPYEAAQFRDHLVACSCCRRDLLTDMQVAMVLHTEPWPGHLCRSTDDGWRCARLHDHDGIHASHGWAHTWSGS